LQNIATLIFMWLHYFNFALMIENLIWQYKQLTSYGIWLLCAHTLEFCMSEHLMSFTQPLMIPMYMHLIKQQRWRRGSSFTLVRQIGQACTIFNFQLLILIYSCDFTNDYWSGGYLVYLAVPPPLLSKW